MSDKGDKTITLSIDTLKELIQDGAKRAVADVMAGQLDADAQFESAVAEFRGKNQRQAITVVYHDCESPLTGATFRGKCLLSKAFPGGRLVDLEDYTYPAHVGQYVPPDEKNPESNAISRERWEHERFLNYWAKDLGAFAGGKPFTSALLRTEADRRRAIDAAPKAT